MKRNMKYLAVSCWLLLPMAGFGDYIDVLTLNTAIRKQIDENERQSEAKRRQLGVTASETGNTEQAKSFRARYEKIRGRLNKLGLALDVFIISSEARPIVARIVKTQRKIYEECSADPKLIQMAIRSEAEFVGRANLLLQYMAGLMIVIGDVYQMKPSDRKMLLNHAVRELKHLDLLSSNLYSSIYWHKRAVALQKLRFRHWINRERDIINEIIRNAKSYG